METLDVSTASELLRLHPDPCAILSPDGTVLAQNAAFQEIGAKGFGDKVFLQRLQLSLRSNGAVPVRVPLDRGEAKQGTMSTMVLGSKRYAFPRIRTGRTEFQKLSRGLERFNAKISARSRVEITLRQVLDAAAEGVLVCSADGTVLEANTSSETLVGQISQINALIPQKSWESLAAESDTTKRPDPIRILRRDALGNELILDVSLGKSKTVDGAIYVILVQDRTDKTRLERAVLDVESANQIARQASTRDTAKTRFLSMISHELRTPLHGVISALELMELEIDAAGELRSLHTIATRAAEAALDQVNRVLEISRFETRVGSDLVNDPFDPADICYSVIEQLQAFATRRGNQVTLSQSGLTGVSVIGDAYLFRQIVQNLISNALKFTKDGSVDIRIDLRMLDDGMLRLDLTVADSGVGFDIAQKERLLREFETGSNRYSKIEEGAGIGLSLVNRAISRMNGILDISSTPGRGSAFRVVLDLAPSQQLPRAAKSEPTKAKTFALSVLVVDDGEINRIVLTKMLVALGCVVEDAQDGITALQKLASGRYDIAFMDISMPGMDGIEATAAYFANAPGNPPRIVGLTAHVDDETRNACLSAGMSDVMTKPLRRSALEDFLTAFQLKGDT